MKLIFILFFILLNFAYSDNNQESSEIFTFVCTFDKVCTPEDGIEKNTDESFPPIRYIYKAGDTYALMSGNAGTVEVLAIPGTDSINFIQLAPVLVTTTICTKTSEVVHSRNVVLLGTLMPSQYYGYAICK